MFPGLLRIQVERLMTSVIALVITVNWLRCEANCQTLLGVLVSLRTSAPISAMYTSIHTAGEANSKTLILMFLAPLSNKPFIFKLKYFLEKSTASFLYYKSQWIHPSEMAHLVHNAFYKLAAFQAHKLFFDNIYRSILSWFQSPWHTDR